MTDQRRQVSLICVADHVLTLQQPSVRPNISADIPSQQAAGQQAAGQQAAGHPQEPNIQRQYVPMPPGPVRPPNVLLRDNDH